MKRIILLCCLISGCSSMKRQMHTAEKYEQNGMKESAIQIYQDMYEQKNNVDAHIALNRLFQEQVFKTVSEIKFLGASGDYDQALSRCEILAQDLENATWFEPNHSLDVVALKEQIKNDQSQHLLKELRELIMNHEHNKADQIIEKINKGGIQSEEFNHLVRLNQLIPLYLNAEKAYQKKYFAEAHDSYLAILDLDPYYKDAQAKLEDCHEKLKFTLAFISDNKGYQSAGSPIAKAIKKELHNIETPFMTLIDPEHDELVLEEQRRSMTGLTERSIEGGNLLEANYLLIGKVQNYNSSVSPSKRFKREGFDGSITRSEKVRYMEVHQTMKVYLVYTYEVVDTESGKVLTSGEMTIEEDVQNNHIEYDGNRVNLHPGNWSFGFVTLKSDFVDLAGKEELDVMLARKTLLGREQQILDKFWLQLAEQVAGEIECLVLGGDFF
ncbi:MAG: hypothetical protein ACPGED_06410 [Flavobacteriales bacterium]